MAPTQVRGWASKVSVNRPTPDPSKEGRRTVGARVPFPAWEGLGVGSGEHEARLARSFQRRTWASNNAPTGTTSSPNALRQILGPGAKASIVNGRRARSTPTRKDSPTRDSPPPMMMTCG